MFDSINIGPNMPSAITDTFLMIIALATAFGILIRIFRRYHFLEYLPNFVTSLGILGTFLGIFIGLYHFDVHDIDKSIPALLSGLKTAFLTSIAGILASLIMRLIFEFKNDYEEHKNHYIDPIPLVNSILKEIELIRISSEKTNNLLVKCFRSDEEYSLVSQVKLIRQEIIDARRDIGRGFEEFAKHLAEVGTKSLVEALRKVIDEFDVLLNELVGESFKELSSAMISLNRWQDDYKKHIEKTEERIELLANNTEKIYMLLNDLGDHLMRFDNSISNISNSISTLRLNGDKLADAMQTISSQNKLLEESIVNINEIGRNARNVIPEISRNIDALTLELKSTVSNVSEGLELGVNQFVDSISLNYSNMENKIVKMQDSLQKSVELLNKQLEDQLTLSLDSLASSLASLSAKFAQDYAPLTNRLRKIIEIAERIDENDNTN